MKVRYRHFFAICFFLVGFSVLGQVPFVQQYALTRRNDPVSINRILQDPRGYMWFATNKGLFRFDGRKYKQFTLADSLPVMNVTALAVDSVGRLWAGFQSGAIAYQDDDHFISFQPREGTSPEPISDIVFDRQGNLWFSTFNDGLYYYRQDNERLFRLDEADGMPDLFVYDLDIDEQGHIWAGTDGGIAICKLIDGKSTIEVISSNQGLPDNIIKKIVFIDSATAILGTEDSGVVLYNITTKRSKKIVEDWPHGSITDVVVKRNQVWIASTKSGLRKYIRNENQLVSYDLERGIEWQSVASLYVDSEGNIWGGTRSGVIRTPGDEFEFISLSKDDKPTDVLSVTESSDGTIWYSDVNGLHKIIPGKTPDNRNILAGTPYAKFRVISLYVDEEQYVWAGFYGEGVIRISPAGSIRYFQSELRNGNVLHISGKQNVVWLATLGGSEKIEWNGNDFKIKHYSRENGLSSDFIYQVYTDSRDRVWFATDGKGVDMLDEKGFHHLEDGLPSRVVYGFAEDKSGGIWVNTQEGGVVKWNGTKFEAISAELRSENIRSLTADANGNLVIAHDLGLDVFNSELKQVHYYGEDVGLRDNLVNLNADHVANNASSILFGTTEGIVVYRPESFFNVTPRIFIETVKINGKPVRVGEELTFAYDENDLNINFLGFWYRDPQNVRYQYKMENFDPATSVTGENNVSYSKLPPGTYSFSVAGMLTDNGLKSPLATLSFTIRPPFWRTNTFYILSGVAISLSVFGIIRYRERKLKEDNLLLERKVEERTLEIQRNTEEIQAQNEEIMAQAEEIKGINENLEMLVQQRTLELEKKNRALEEYAFINAHKLRSPVASILGLVNLLSKSRLDPEAKHINDRLQQSAEELNSIVRSITEAIERGER